VGGLAAGYYLVRLRTGEDVRHLGSGSVGARNVGRRLGRPGLIITFVLDLLKGSMVAGAAQYWHLSPWGIVLALVAVVAGHVWPAWLRFRGGKGISTSLGALLVYDSSIIAILFALFLPLWALMRKFVLSGLLAFALAPLVLLALERSLQSIVGLSLLAVIIVFAHRRNIGEEINRYRTRRKLEQKKAPCKLAPRP
jgi:glycerol-3-phosphate acyltransferase PlsY